MGKLDTAIKVLYEAYGEASQIGESEWVDSIDIAIHILEAAAKVPKKDVLDWIDYSYNIYDTTLPEKDPRTIFDLINALPDEEGE